MERPETSEFAGRPWTAADATRRTRPGVPREQAEPPVTGAHWSMPEQQHDVGPLVRSGIRTPTPVFGTAQPPRLLSGALRRLAYGVPEHRATRWVLLLLADRVDVVEHRLREGVLLVPIAIGLGVGYVLVGRALRD